MIGASKLLYVTAAVSGAMTKLVFDQASMDWKGWLAFSVICLIGLAMGSIARLGMFDPKTVDMKFERRRTVMIFGALYLITLWIAETSNANILTAPLIGAATGAAGPIAINWLVAKFFGEKP